MTKYGNSKDIKTMKHDTMSINGKRIKTVRNALGLTQQELVSELEMRGGKSFISNVEHGKRPIPASVLPYLADKVDRPVEYFFSDRNISYNEGNILYKCFQGLNVDDKTINYTLKYMDGMVDKAIDNVGAGQLFDIIYSVVRICSKGKPYSQDINEAVLKTEGNDFDYSYHFNYVKNIATEMYRDME